MFVYGRVFLLVLIPCLAVTVADGQPDGSAKSSEPAEGMPAADEALPDVSVDEAIRKALEALDDLEAADGPEAMAATIARVNRHTEIVRTAEPGNPWLHSLYGRAYALTGRRGDAIDQLQKFVETREGRNDWAAHRVLGDLFVDQFPRLARANYKKAAVLKPGEPRVLFGLSLCAGKIGNWDDALGFAREAVAADGGRTIRYVDHLARLFLSRRLWGEARKEAETALKLARQAGSTAPDERAPLERLDAQYQLLIEILNGELAENPQVVEGYLAAVRCSRARAENALGIARLEMLRILELGMEQFAPEPPPQLLEEYAKTLAELGRSEAAIVALEQLIAADPANNAARDSLNRLRAQQPAKDRGVEP